MQKLLGWSLLIGRKKQWHVILSFVLGSGLGTIGDFSSEQLLRNSRRLHAENQLRFSMDNQLSMDSGKVDTSVFIGQRNISFQNDISLKTMRLGVLS